MTTSPPAVPLNERALRTLRELDTAALRIDEVELGDGVRWWDFGIDAVGGIDAGLVLAGICTSNLATTTIGHAPFAGRAWPHVEVRTSRPVEACLFSQYAGWAITPEGWFGMGSGPMRAAAAVEELFDEFAVREQTERVAGVIESGHPPTAEVVGHVAERCGVGPADVALCVAPTASQAGNVQIVARSVETAMHKLHELDFDVRRIVGGTGTAPLPPVAEDDLTGIGRTNDAILYGGTVHLWATGDDDALAEIVRRVPSSASPAHGRPFLELFAEAGHDFYAIDPHLFSPAVVVIQNVDTGRVHAAGSVELETLRRSFGLA